MKEQTTSEKMLRSLVYDLACAYVASATHSYQAFDDQAFDARLKKVGILDERGWSTIVETTSRKTHICTHVRTPRQVSNPCLLSSQSVYEYGCGREGFGEVERAVPRKDAEKYVTCKGCLAAMKKGKV